MLLIGEHADGSTTTISPDTVYSILTGDRKFTKAQVERTVIEHFRKAIAKIHPELSFTLEPDAIKRRENASPDFFIRRNGARLGLDVTDYAFSDRRAADARFEEVKLALAQAYRKGRFRMGERMSVWLRFANRDINFKQVANDMDELIAALDQILVTPSIEDWMNQSSVMAPVPYPSIKAARRARAGFSGASNRSSRRTCSSPKVLTGSSANAGSKSSTYSATAKLTQRSQRS